MQLFSAPVISVDGLGAEWMEKVDRLLEQMRLDVDRDVRVLAGGEKQLVNRSRSKDCLLVTEDEMDEQPRNLVSHKEIGYGSRERRIRQTLERGENFSQNELSVWQDASSFFHTND